MHFRMCPSTNISYIINMALSIYVRMCLSRNSKTIYNFVHVCVTATPMLGENISSHIYNPVCKMSQRSPVTKLKYLLTWLVENTVVSSKTS